MVITPFSKSERINGADPRENVPYLRDATRPERAVPNTSAQREPNVLNHPIGHHALTALRNSHTSAKQLRYFSNQLLFLLTMEATRALTTRDVSVEGFSGDHIGRQLNKPMIFVSLARHGLGMAHNIADFVPEVCVGNITLDLVSEGQTLEPRLHLANAPALNESKVILFDPIVGAGLSVSIALNMLRKAGAIELALVSFVISAVGLKRIQSTSHETPIWTAAIDDDFDPKRGPLPGVGDLGKRLYGAAKQSGR